MKIINKILLFSLISVFALICFMISFFYTFKIIIIILIIVMVINLFCYLLTALILRSKLTRKTQYFISDENYANNQLSNINNTKTNRCTDVFYSRELIAEDYKNVIFL